MKTRKYVVILRMDVDDGTNPALWSWDDLHKINTTGYEVNVQEVGVLAEMEEVEERALINQRLREALEDIARQPEGDEQSAQAVAREALKTIK